MQTLHKVKEIQYISSLRTTAKKNGWETLETATNGKIIVHKRLVKQRKQYLYLARKSFKNHENIKQKREAGNILQEQEVFRQSGGLESPLFMLVIAFHKLYQQH